MKKILLILITALLIVSCSTEPRYRITGNIDGADSITFLLQKREEGKIVTIDSAFAVKGSFKMQGGSVTYPEMVLLTAKESRLRTTFYLENSDISINGSIDSLESIRITGSKTQDEFKAFNDSESGLNEKYDMLYAEYQSASQRGDTASMARLEKDAELLQKELVEIEKNFIRNNPSSFVAPSVLSGLSYELEPDEIELFINAMDTTVANIPVMKELKEKVELMKTVSVGQKAPDFTLNNPEGNPVSLSSKIGSKLLLVDFWAGWCGPCRQENPNVVKVYNEFNKKGFDVFGVSLDRTREEWLKAISDDKLTWTHVSDLQYWNSTAAKLYAVNAIPANFLLDENGVIIARNLRGEDLYKKVREVLGNQ